MVKYLLNSLLILLLLTSLSFAKARNEDGKLQNEYGKDLTHVPFFLRFDYKAKYHQDWSKTYYSDRKYFLMDYETNLAAEKRKEKAEAKAEAAKAKARAQEKKAELLKIKNRLKAQSDEEKAEAREDRDRQKEFNAEVRAQQKELQQLEQGR